ncbi:hypothetical protein ACIGG6_18115 [Vreelandella lionensis]|uniref:Uncharacterized protein n=1 Tax=Vreelandella lionensis TaxID=1144478 RepID=A0ABW8C085_9GAMM
MLEILASKQVDIYISLVISLIGAVFGIVLDRSTKGKGGAAPEGGGTHAISVSMQQVVRVSVGSKSSADDQLMLFFVGVFLLVVGVAYLFFRQEVLVAGLLLVLFIFGAWAGSVANSLYSGFYDGWRWVVYLLVMLLFALAAVRVVGLAKTPMFAPSNFIYAQDIVNQWGILALPRYFTALDFQWFGFHLLGIILFFAASWRACLSMLNYAVLGTRLSKGAAHTELGGRIASAYGRPWRNSLFLLGFMVAANYLVSGQFFMWFEYEMPNQLEYFIQVVLHGRQAG